MVGRFLLIAALSFLPATGSLAQVAPVDQKSTILKAPLLKAPVKPAQKSEPAKSTISPKAQTAKSPAQANTRIIRPGIRFMDFDNTNQGDYQIRYIVPNIADRPASEIIVERKGICGWTESSFDGSPAPRAEKEHAGCAYFFRKFSAAVAALAEAPPAHQHYYALVVDKYNRATEHYSKYMAQPVMVVVHGPGARVTRHKLEVLPTARATGEAPPKIDRDGDGFSPISEGGTDCDDNDNSRYPGNTEVPNDKDEDCDPNTIGVMDRDGDGFTDWNVSNPAFGNRSRPLQGRDCDDSNPAVRPTAPEDLRDGIDNNCDGDVDFVS